MSPLKASYFLPSLGIFEGTQGAIDAMALCRDAFLLAIASIAPWVPSKMLSKGAFQ